MADEMINVRKADWDAVHAEVERLNSELEATRNELAILKAAVQELVARRMAEYQQYLTQTCHTQAQ